MGLALVAAAIVLLAPAEAGTVLAIATGALLGGLLRRVAQRPAAAAFDFGLSKVAGALSAALFVALLILAPVAAARTQSGPIAVLNAFYRTGALVFGGGHVVLPLLENAVVARGWVDQQSFLAGYGAAQALPGPLFTFAAYLGAAVHPTLHPIALAAIALLAIFLPGVLLMVAVLPFWSSLRRSPWMQSGLLGVNAAVVGVLIAAFVRPVWSSAVHTAFDLALVLGAFALLVRWKVAPWIVVVAVASVGAAASVR
jgi:chromate transporter